MTSEPDRKILFQALEKSFGLDEAGKIMSDPRALNNSQPNPGPVWSDLNGCWFFIRYDTMIGVEKDGYVHS